MSINLLKKIGKCQGEVNDIMKNTFDTGVLLYFYIFPCRLYFTVTFFYLFIVLLLSNFSLAIASGPTAPGFNT